MKTYYVIKADLENHPNCIDDKDGIYVNKTMENYTSLQKAIRFHSHEEAKRHIIEAWEIVEEIVE
jgi:hypothetical protein